MASEFYLVLPSNSSMITYPNNTLAQYITNLPRRINISGVWECGLTEIHYPHDWYNVRNARLTVEHDGNMETDVCFEDGYYHSPEALATTLNGDKPGRVKFTVHYQPTTSHKSLWCLGKRPHRYTISARLVQPSKRQIDGSTRRQRVNGRVL